MPSLAASLPRPLDALPAPAPVRAYAPEKSPFQTLIVDVTHRCNMACRNCYIPNRHVADMDPAWLAGILRRLPRRTRVRIVGAEPTVRKDLPDLIRLVRDCGHIPLLLTNGLKLADASYVRELKRAGLRICYVSLNGGLRDDLYEAIDGGAYAAKKLAALDHLIAGNFYVSAGMILVRGVNTGHVPELWKHLRPHRPVREFSLRSIGRFGRYMQASEPLSLSELLSLARGYFPGAAVPLKRPPSGSHVHFRAGNVQIQLTEWPELGSSKRGRLTPEGKVQPFFEHVLANEGGY